MVKYINDINSFSFVHLFMRSVNNKSARTNISKGIVYKQVFLIHIKNHKRLHSRQQCILCV